MGGNDEREPTIVEVKRNSLDDGPGVRSVVFFKGCPLRCVWCQNPEALSRTRQLRVDPGPCIGCGACAEACPTGAASRTDREGCRLCFACVDACPSGARSVVGRSASAGELSEILLRDEPFYRASGGGVTLSGGEPTMHLELAGEVARRLQAAAVHVLLETCGHFPFEPFEAELLPHLDAIYMDVKLARAEEHRRHTGVGNERILGNLARLAEPGRPELLVRVPLVPGITDGDDNLAAIAGILARLGIGRVALLAYNPLWPAKTHALGLAPDPTLARREWMADAEVERCRGVMRSAGLEVV